LNNIVPVCTVEDVRAEFARRGLSVSEWARRNGVSAQLTYQILAGRKLGLRGQSHTICVLLGLKPGIADASEGLTFISKDQWGNTSKDDEGEETRQAQPA
jgi:gp16 family phage-associated protein